MKNSRENRKGNFGIKLKKIAKTQVFGKSTCVNAPPDCEKKPGVETVAYAHSFG